MTCLKWSLVTTGENRPVTKEGIMRCVTVGISRICNNSHNFHNVHTCLFVPMQNETTTVFEYFQWEQLLCSLRYLPQLKWTFNYLQNTSIKGMISIKNTVHWDCVERPKVLNPMQIHPYVTKVVSKFRCMLKKGFEYVFTPILHNKAVSR
jgi:hypothetical protein